MRATALLLAAALLVGCTDEPTEGAASSPSPSPSVPLLGTHAGAVEAGTYRMRPGSGTGSPEVLVEVSGGYRADSPWFLVSHDNGEFLGLYTVSVVPRDPCDKGALDMVRLDATVGSFVDALVDQASTRTSKPRPVRVAGYDGTYVELTSPRDLTGCREEPELWDGRGVYGAGQVDRLWVLDVDGQRLVVDAASSTGTKPLEVDRLVEMVWSMRVAG